MPKQLKKIKVKKARQPRQPRRQGIPRKPPVTNISVNIAGGSNQPAGSYYFPNVSESVNLFRPRIEEPVRQVVEMGTQTKAPKKFEFGTQTTAPKKFELGTQTIRDVVELGTQTTAPKKFELATQTTAPKKFELATQTIRDVVELGTQTTAPKKFELGTQTTAPKKIQMETQTIRDVVELGTQTTAPKKKLRIVADVGFQTQPDIIEMGTQTQEEPLPISAVRRVTPFTTEKKAFNPNNKTLLQIQEAARSVGIIIVNEAGKNYTKKQLAKMINQII